MRGAGRSPGTRAGRVCGTASGRAVSSGARRRGSAWRGWAGLGGAGPGAGGRGQGRGRGGCVSELLFGLLRDLVSAAAGTEAPAGLGWAGPGSRGGQKREPRRARARSRCSSSSHGSGTGALTAAAAALAGAAPGAAAAAARRGWGRGRDGRGAAPGRGAAAGRTPDRARAGRLGDRPGGAVQRRHEPQGCQRAAHAAHAAPQAARLLLQAARAQGPLPPGEAPAQPLRGAPGEPGFGPGSKQPGGCPRCGEEARCQAGTWPGAMSQPRCRSCASGRGLPACGAVARVFLLARAHSRSFGGLDSPAHAGSNSLPGPFVARWGLDFKWTGISAPDAYKEPGVQLTFFFWICSLQDACQMLPNQNGRLCSVGNRDATLRAVVHQA